MKELDECIRGMVMHHQGVILVMKHICQDNQFIFNKPSNYNNLNRQSLLTFMLVNKLLYITGQ